MPATCHTQVVAYSGAPQVMAPFDWDDKPVEKHCWLICRERKILFQLKKEAEKDGL
jgi:hypothetical protein